MSTYGKGLLITLLGVLVITPDTLLLRLIEADIWTLAFWRGLLSGAAVLLGFAALNGRKAPAQMLAMGLPGIWITVTFAFGTLAFLYSVTQTSIANTLFIASTSPIFAALIARFILREHVSLRTWLTIAATLVGIGIIAYGSIGGGIGSIEGDIAALGAAISLAITFSIARANRSASMVPATGLAGLLTGLIGLLVAPDIAIAREDWIWVGLLGLVVAPLGFALLATGPRYLPAPDVSLILLLEAVLGPLLVWWVLAEYPGNMTMIGGVIVLGAMAISNLIAARSRAT